MFVKYFTLFFVFCLQYLIASSNSCGTKKTCKECIRDPSVCVWCAENDFKETRCIPLNSYKDGWCNHKSLQNPKNFVNATETQEFSSDSNHVIQIKPQRFKLNLRPGKPQDFPFSFQGAENYPVDIYFLLDASATMSKVKDATAIHSENIYMAIKNMTNNVRLGLGTFVDKRVLPFANTSESDSEKIYSFRHRLKLVDDFNLFKELVPKTPIGINRDKPEGGLDALAQVMACNDVIEWRNESRKIIVFMTDNLYHVAGDGKSAGLFQPYDGKCYTVNNVYTKERVMDYPSIGMINKLASDTHITVIFLVEKAVESNYQRLSNLVSGSRITSYEKDSFDSDSHGSDAIVSILRDIYVKISKMIKLKTNVRIGPKKKIKFSFNPDCTTVSQNGVCEVEIGKEQQLLGTVKLLEYDESDNAVIDVIVEGIGEKLTLDIDIIKNCDCEKVVQENSTFCSGEKRSCGTCICSDKNLNDRCTNSSSNDTSTCKAAGSTDICSQRGVCIYGTCNCTDGYEGKFCECNSNSCPRDLISGQACSGHGKCVCGKCECDPDWSGVSCDCYNLNVGCKGNGDQICSNRGHCHCGVCKCESIGSWDARDYEDKVCKMHCSDCHTMQCRKLEDCAKCQRKQQDDCLECDERIQAMVFKTLPEEYLRSSDWNVCSNMKVEVGCYSKFLYQYIDNSYGLRLIVSTEENCAETYYMFGGFFLFTLLLIGAGTLIAWKLMTDARDRQEYLRFLKQHQQDSTGPCINPLYENPSTMVKNPTFRKKSVDIYTR